MNLENSDLRPKGETLDGKANSGESLALDGLQVLVVDDHPDSREQSNSAHPVVAIAASAGGLKALSHILRALPSDFPAAIAIVLHTSPDRRSFLAEILNRCTSLSVKEAKSGYLLCPAMVFIAPPNFHLLVNSGGIISLCSSSKIHHTRPSAEPLFHSVAANYRTKAIGVILTGGDHDGSSGIQRIKQMGGKTIAQDQATSEHFSMPRSAISTGYIDFVLPLNEIAPTLVQLVRK
jgi:two-component system chemotaxis response regulator CheB